MPESARQAAAVLAGWLDDLMTSASLFVVGMTISVGQSLSKPERPTWSVILGRSIAVGGLSMGAGAALALIPGLPLAALIGIASIMASLGVGGVERFLAARWAISGDQR